MHKKDTRRKVYYTSIRPLTNDFELGVVAPHKCCMRCKHTERFFSCYEDDLLQCDINGNMQKPHWYCVAFERR